MIDYGGEIIMNYYKNAMKYFSKFPSQNSFVHLILGIGIGFIIAYPVVGVHPIRWGGLFILMGAVGMIWAGFQKTK
jgi:hypothetical protein